MGDLAQAIVDLGINADRRREARKNLRQAVDTIVGELLRHLRVGDAATLLADPNDLPFGCDRTYRVEKVTWDVIDYEPKGPYTDAETPPVTYRHPGGATALVRYVDMGAIPRSGRQFDGAVLTDPRKPLEIEHEAWGDLFHRVTGRGIYLDKLSDDARRWDAKLHLATDGDLVLFADDAVRVARAFTSEQANDARRFTEAAATITKLTPR